MSDEESPRGNSQSNPHIQLQALQTNSLEGSKPTFKTTSNENEDGESRDHVEHLPATQKAAYQK